MTQPPQWGAPPQQYPQQRPHQHPQQHSHQHPQYRPPNHVQPPPLTWTQTGPPPGWLPPKPSQLKLAAVLNWILAAGMLLIAAFVIMSFLMSGATLIIGILLAAVVAGFGLLNALGALSINHPHFPNTAATQMAGLFTGLVLAVALFRSVGRGVAELVPSMASAVLLAVCLFNLVLVSRPAVKRWIAAKHQQSLSQGYVPRNRR